MICDSPCKDGCHPARYSKGWPDTQQCNCVETDTVLSINDSNTTLNYKAEKHVDQIKGQQVGNIINLSDLRDVNLDYGDVNAMCAEFIYHRYGGCGSGCKSLEDAWSLFSIDQEGAKQDQLKFVRGANAYGCPTYLNVPKQEDEYWFAGWRSNGQFGYYQANPVSELPKDSNGKTLVLSQTSNGQPVVGPIDFKAFYDEHYCTQCTFEPGFYPESSLSHVFCYYPNRGTMLIALDVLCSIALEAQVLSNKFVCTIQDPRFWPTGVIDLPLHAVYQNNSDGKIMPIWIKIDTKGRVSVTGEITARPTSGKASYIIIGVDDSVEWVAQGNFNQ